MAAKGDQTVNRLTEDDRSRIRTRVTEAVRDSHVGFDVETLIRIGSNAVGVTLSFLTDAELGELETIARLAVVAFTLAELGRKPDAWPGYAAGAVDDAVSRGWVARTRGEWDSHRGWHNAPEWTADGTAALAEHLPIRTYVLIDGRGECGPYTDDELDQVLAEWTPNGPRYRIHRRY